MSGSIRESNWRFDYNENKDKTKKGGHHLPRNERPADANELELNKQIKDMKQKVYRAKVQGIMQRDAQNQEIDDLQMDMFDKKTKLMQLGSACKSYIPFHEYMRIIQTTFQSTKRPTLQTDFIFQENVSNANTKKTNDTAIIPQSYRVAYSIFAFFEAYLLKRLHLAMLLQNQQRIHRESWSNNVAQLFLEISPLKKQFRAIIQELEDQMKRRRSAKA